MPKSLLSSVVVALLLAGCASLWSFGGPDPAAIHAAAIADPLRPPEEVARDPFRDPAAMLAFAEIGPGDRVADVRPGAGYFTRLFAKSVGPTGKVYAFVPDLTAPRENARADALVAAYPNVYRMNGSLETMRFPDPLDVIWISQEYHDFALPFFGPADTVKVNAAMLAALKPGGLLVIVDHAGRPGTRNTEAETLHRIEGAYLRERIEASGFVFDGESAAVANPADDRTTNVFDSPIRGRTDQFVYRFRKPG